MKFYEAYLSMADREKTIIRSACSISNAVKALSLLKVYFPEMTFKDMTEFKQAIGA